jgi:hypothetical protein
LHATVTRWVLSRSGDPFKIKTSSCEYVDSRGTLFDVVLYVLFWLNLDFSPILINLFNELFDSSEPTDNEKYLTDRKIKIWQR